jgi:Zn-dependent protease
VNGLTFGRVFETEVRAHWTWILVLAFISVILGLDLSDGTAAAWPPALAWGSAIATAALVFASVTAHELAHVKVARRNGQRIVVVVVQLLGGPYVMEVKPKNAGEELRIALAGSALSLLLAVGFGVVGGLLLLVPSGIARAPDGIQAVQFVASVVAAFNAVLGVVNLVPGYPLDGARILHALVWRRTGQETAATAASIKAGRWVGGLLIVVGAAAIGFADPVVGLCVMVSGWLMIGSSRFLDRRSVVQNLVAGLLVRDAEDSDPGRVPPQLTLDVFASAYLGERMGAAAFVERGSELLGLIGTAQIRRIPRRIWTQTRTEQAMVPIAAVPTVNGDTDLWSALEILERTGLDALMVGAVGSVGSGAALMTRRSAARLVHERAEERRRELMAQNLVKKSRFRGG